MHKNNKRTIIQNPCSLRYYQFERLDHNVLDAINSAMDESQFTKGQRTNSLSILKLFECFLQVTGRHLFMLDLSHPKFNQEIKEFVGALWSDSFISTTIVRRNYFTNYLYTTLMALNKIIPALCIPTLSIPKISMRNHAISDDISACIKQFTLLSLNEERIYYWQGWWVYNKNNAQRFVPLNGVYERYGRELTERIFNQIEIAFTGMSGPMTMGVTTFCRWLPTSGYDVSLFSDPTSVQCLFQDFLVYYLTTRHKNSNRYSINQLIKNWKDFIRFVEKYFLNIIFAEPYGKLIIPTSTTIKGSERRINTTADGREVKEKLLTDVPLHVTDEQAIELLFHQIQVDFDHIVTTAGSLATNLWQRFQRRKFMAPKGIVKPLEKLTSTHEALACHWLTHKDNPDWLANASATFETHGFAYNHANKPCVHSYSHCIRDIAVELGLPTAYALLPHMVLLVAEHPEIVTSFLTDFELYNKQGKLTGYIKLDGGWVLDGRKRRRGAVYAQQIIHLTPNTKKLVEQIIAITDCVRQHLKEKGDDNWRFLFLVNGKEWSTLSRMASDYAHAKRTTGTFYQALCVSTQDISQKHAEKLSKRFTLGALRASKGVLIYLKTRNVTAMAKALGHKNYNWQLLSHYLPETILDFFQSRWIRIFQQGIIVEAMKESHMLLEATEFTNMKEFHEFMQTHALKMIPIHLEDPNFESNQAIPESSSEIIFSISTGVLSMLLSLQQAVLNAQKRVCGKAAYWAEVTKHLVAYIENCSRHVSGDGLKACLNAAKEQINSVKMEKIIYG